MFREIMLPKYMYEFYEKYHSTIDHLFWLRQKMEKFYKT